MKNITSRRTRRDTSGQNQNLNPRNRQDSGSRTDGAELVDAKTAALLLGVKTQTLYAYVSRGLIATVPNPGRRSNNMYRIQDVEALRANPRNGNFSRESFDRVVRWGTGATLRTAITSVDSAGPRYRGKLATDLASMHHTFEDCVELLWAGGLPTRPALWPPAIIPDTFRQFTDSLRKVAKSSSFRQLLALLTTGYAACIGRNPEIELGAPVLAGRQLLQVLAPSLGLLHPRPRYEPSLKAEPLAWIIAASAGASRNDATIQAINAALVLSADHELAPSTFAARVAASGGADIFSCVSSGLGTFEGPTTGFGCDEPEALLRPARSAREYIAALREHTQHKKTPLGYNHPLYPDGDPRARHLLELAKSINNPSPRSREVLNCIRAATDEMGLVPSFAIGLVAISAALELPLGTPGALMAIGRVSGWIAHVLEQRLSGTLIRPRTRYIGPASSNKQ